MDWMQVEGGNGGIVQVSAIRCAIRRGLCLNVFQNFLENVYRENSDDGRRRIIPKFTGEQYGVNDRSRRY